MVICSNCNQPLALGDLYGYPSFNDAIIWCDDCMTHFKSPWGSRFSLDIYAYSVYCDRNNCKTCEQRYQCLTEGYAP